MGDYRVSGLPQAAPADPVTGVTTRVPADADTATVRVPLSDGRVVSLEVDVAAIRAQLRAQGIDPAGAHVRTQPVRLGVTRAAEVAEAQPAPAPAAQPAAQPTELAAAPQPVIHVHVPEQPAPVVHVHVPPSQPSQVEVERDSAGLVRRLRQVPA